MCVTKRERGSVLEREGTGIQYEKQQQQKEKEKRKGIQGERNLNQYLYCEARQFRNSN